MQSKRFYSNEDVHLFSLPNRLNCFSLLFTPLLLCRLVDYQVLVDLSNNLKKGVYPDANAAYLQR